MISGRVQTSGAIVLIEITSELEAQVGNLEGVFVRADEVVDASKRPQFVFPGISNILLGVITGDLRRIVEDGAFHFLSKGARDQAVSIYRNLIGNRIASRGTTKATTTTARTNSTSAAEDPDEVEGTDSSEGTDVTEEPDESELTTEVTTSRSRFSRRTRRTQAPVAETTVRSAQEPDGEEEEELVSRFEKALRPYLPSNPQDAVVEEYPEIVGKKVDVAA